MASVTLRGISKTFESAKAPTIADLDLDVADGEFMVLVGPSGCGKSTTLRMIAGLEDPTGGEIRIGERVVNEVAPKDRDIAMVFQNYALYPHMSVRENLAFGLKLRKVAKDEIMARVAETAGLLEIEEYLDRKPKALSGGQRQRVALGRAIIRKPTVFLFDEPLSNLDAKLRVAMRTEIKKLHYQLGTTMIYVTHDQVEAMTMGDRICVMRAGVIHQVDTPLALYANPADIFVAGFIGNPAMNFLRLRVGEGVAESADGAIRLALPAPLAERLRPFAGREIVLGMRPEHISTDGSGGTPVALDTQHDVSELLGNEMILYLTAGEARIVARSPAATPLRPGVRVRVYLDVEHAHCFDAMSERRID